MECIFLVDKNNGQTLGPPCCTAFCFPPIKRVQAAALERRGVELRSQLLPAELHEAATQAKSRLRDPCSAGIGAFQV